MGQLNMKQTVSLTTPREGWNAIAPKTDGHWYARDENGAEINLTGGPHTLTALTVSGGGLLTLESSDVGWAGWEVGQDASGRLVFSHSVAEVRFTPTGALSIGGTDVLTTRQPGWAAATGTATRTTFATGSVTLPQLAERMKAMIDDLIAHGLIGA